MDEDIGANREPVGVRNLSPAGYTESMAKRVAVHTHRPRRDSEALRYLGVRQAFCDTASDLLLSCGQPERSLNRGQFGECQAVNLLPQVGSYQLQ